MRISKTVIIYLVFLYSSHSFANNGQFDKAMNFINDFKFDSSLAIVNLLDNKSPEYCILMMNFYFKKALVFRLGAPHEPYSDHRLDSLRYIDEGHFDYIPDTIDKGISILKAGISQYPDRLDMRLLLVNVESPQISYSASNSELHKIFLKGGISQYPYHLILDVDSPGKYPENYSAMNSELQNILKQSLKNKNQWLWSFRKKKTNGKRFMLENVQRCASMLFNEIDYDTGIDSLFFAISEDLIKYYPKCVYGHINLKSLIAYYTTHNNKKGLEYSYKAIMIDPKDPFIIANIAEINERMGNNSEALKYYKLMNKYGNSKMKAEAKAMIIKLSK